MHTMTPLGQCSTRSLSVPAAAGGGGAAGESAGARAATERPLSAPWLRCQLVPSPGAPGRAATVPSGPGPVRLSLGPGAAAPGRRPRRESRE